MNHKYLILLLFIFLVFLMGSVNSTVTNVFYNNTTGTQDHALLTNLSYADSNHTGFQSSSTLDNDIATLGYITNTTGNFVKKTGDTMTGTLSLTESSELNLTTSKTFNFDFANLPRLYRNYTSGLYRLSPLATVNMILSVNGGIGNGGGPAMIFWNKGNESEGREEKNIGRVAVVWDNKELNTSKISFYGRSGVDDTAGLTPLLEAYTAQNNEVGCYGYGTGACLQNSTVETGNLKLLNLSGSGNAYSCLDSAGKLYRGTPGC